jgi:large subunit ribosomal protein L15
MKLHELKPQKGSVKGSKRVGRGEGSGKGGTSTRGHKGAKSRSGYSKKVGFEGGQMPLQRRVPKFGFTNINRKEFTIINLDQIQSLIENKKITSLDIDLMVSNGLAGHNDMIKVLGRGELKGKIDVKVNAISETARKAIEDKGGKVELV